MNSPILLKPIITERSFKDASNSIFTFLVSVHTDKGQIRSEVEKLFGVHVEDVRTMHMTGKKRLVGKRRTKVAEKDWKKAKVKLKSGEKIALFETEAGSKK